MSLSLQFFNLIQRFDSSGGYKQLLKQHPSRFGSNIWYDRTIIRNSETMNWMDIEYILDSLSKNGLSITKRKNGKTYWDEICVAASMTGISEYECDWLEYDESTNSVKTADDDGIMHGPVYPGLESRNDITTIYGSFKGLDNTFAGSVLLDNINFGFNSDCYGRFVIHIPDSAVRQHNQLSNHHTLTFKNYATGASTQKDFILEECGEIEINE